MCVCVCMLFISNINLSQVIKLYAWEMPFKHLISFLRKQELQVFQKSAYVNAGITFFWTMAPVIVSVCVFICMHCN